MRVLLLSAYDAPSHRYWREVLCENLTDWDWHTFTLPPRHFSWRIRGNALSLAQQLNEQLNGNYDCVLATSMVDVVGLRAFVPQLAKLPCVLYFHENQFAYPANLSTHGAVEAQMMGLYSALASDALVFNSAFNRASFMEGCAELLAKLPDHVPPGLVEQLRAKSDVIPVPIDELYDLVKDNESRVAQDKLQLVWNHRWEYDKGPRDLLALASALVDNKISFTLHVVGQQFRQQPSEFEELRQLLEHNNSLGEWGFIGLRQQYRQLLAKSDVVVSTALHDFQGLAVLEACQLGCGALVPDRQVYPEWFGSEHCYKDIPDAVRRLEERRLASVDSALFSPDTLIPVYEKLIHGLTSSKSV